MPVMRPDGLSVADHRSLLKIERLAAEIRQQCGFLRKNAASGAEDRLRFVLIGLMVFALQRAARSAERRYERDRKHLINAPEMSAALKETVP